MQRLKSVLMKSMIIVSLMTIIFITAALTYFVLHRNLVHDDDISRPIYVTLSTCNTDIEGGLCSCQKGNAILQQKLVPGDSYSLYLEINIPDSEQIHEMFNICMKLVDVYGASHIRSCRRIMVPYRTKWIRRAHKMLNYSPLYIFGLKEESQDLVYDLLHKYDDDKIGIVESVAIEIHSIDLKHTSIYLRVAPKYFGIKYVMFHWPLLSAVVGIWILFCAITIATFLVYSSIRCCFQCLIAMV